MRLSFPNLAILAAGTMLVLAGCGSGESLHLSEPAPPEVSHTLEQISALEAKVRVLEEERSSVAISDDEAEEIKEQIATLKDLIAVLQLQLDLLELAFARLVPSLEPRLAVGIPQQDTSRYQQSPVISIEGDIHIGTNVELPDNLRAAFGAPERVVSARADYYEGLLLSDVTWAQVIDYLEHDYRQQGSHYSGNIQRFGAIPPIVRINFLADDELTDVVVRAVQIVNAALPHYYQLEISEFPAFSDAPSDGEITIEFAPRSEWTGTTGYVSFDVDGLANAWYNEKNTITKGRIWIDHTRRTTDEERINAVVHELLHTLGRGHPSSFLYSETIMLPTGPGVPGHALHPLDVKALQAMYMFPTFTVSVGSLEEDFGDWSNEVDHLVADFGDGVFIGLANDGLSHSPWAQGPAPEMTLAGNAALLGTARWSGLLMGTLPYQPDQPQGSPIGTIGGSADLAVSLDDLTGDLEFTRLRYLRDSPDGPRAKDTWRDGYLEYDVIVEGNTFVQTGGDDGIVTGAFFRASHEAMGGTLQRSDLIAVFGGTR